MTAQDDDHNYHCNDELQNDVDERIRGCNAVIATI